MPVDTTPPTVAITSTVIDPPGQSFADAVAINDAGQVLLEADKSYVLQNGTFVPIAVPPTDTDFPLPSGSQTRTTFAEAMNAAGDLGGLVFVGNTSQTLFTDHN